jgi:hypothetical protein
MAENEGAGDGGSTENDTGNKASVRDDAMGNNAVVMVGNNTIRYDAAGMAGNDAAVMIGNDAIGYDAVRYGASA